MDNWVVPFWVVSCMRTGTWGCGSSGQAGQASLEKGHRCRDLEAPGEVISEGGLSGQRDWLVQRPGRE